MDGFSNSKKNSEHNEKDRQDNPFSNKEETHNKHGVQEQKKRHCPLKSFGGERRSGGAFSR
jgi:hypothetical protein